MNELTYLKINNQEVKQLIYSQQGQDVNPNDFVYETVYKGYTCKNNLVYATEPSRLNDFSIYNEDIESSYIPEFQVTFDYMTKELYAWLMQQVNTKGFTVEYYDYELLQDVKRKMYMSNSALSKFHNVGTNLKALLDVEMTFVSKYGYNDYQELKTKQIESF